jgi:outer membrane protein OmpA-like peptidoglycan-associated protein
VASFIRKNQGQRVVVVCGHTDHTGNPNRNATISENRASVVTRALDGSGITVAKTVGLGHARPLMKDTSEEGRAANRRVEVWLVSPRALTRDEGSCP